MLVLYSAFLPVFDLRRPKTWLPSLLDAIQTGRMEMQAEPGIMRHVHLVPIRNVIGHRKTDRAHVAANLWSFHSTIVKKVNRRKEAKADQLTKALSQLYAEKTPAGSTLTLTRKESQGAGVAVGAELETIVFTKKGTGSITAEIRGGTGHSTKPMTFENGRLSPDKPNLIALAFKGIGNDTRIMTFGHPPHHSHDFCFSEKHVLRGQELSHPKVLKDLPIDHYDAQLELAEARGKKRKLFHAYQLTRKEVERNQKGLDRILEVFYV